ncbi:MAG: hypothetical protein Q4E73_05985 [Lachnospiraceae bacterium]|nr:hypothetical protein [Lachnospiraceae bacterium]
MAVIHRLRTKKQRNRMRKTIMSFAVLILAGFFFFSVSGQGMEESIGQSKIDLQKVQNENWKTGEKKEYVDRALKIYDTLAKYQKMDMTRDEFHKELTQNYMEWEKENPSEYYDKQLGLSYFIKESKVAKKYEEQLKNGDDCYDSSDSGFSYEVDGNMLLVYCKAHHKLNDILPYRLSDSDLSHELEKDGLKGLCGWMKEIENSGETVKTKEGKKIKASHPEGYTIFGNIPVEYDDMEITFKFDRYHASSYQYLDDMMKSVEKIGWKISDIMPESYEKGIRCYYTEQNQKQLDEEFNMILRAELIADKDKVKQLSLDIPVYDVKTGEQLITDNREAMKQMLIYAGMDSNKAQELIDELKCVSKKENGVKGGFSWNLTRMNDNTWTDENQKEVACCEYVLILSKVK